MSLNRIIIRQLNDLVVYLLIPGFFLICPAAFSRRMLGHVSGWRWLLAEDAELAFRSAGRHVAIADSEQWKRRWKQVELLDVRDLYMMMLGRSRTIVSEIECPADFEMVRNRVMVGMHWGPAVSLVRLLADSAMRPAIPFRPAERRLLGSRPFYYVFSRLAAHYLTSTCDDRAVPVGGAGKVLQALLNEPGSPIVVMDAPPMPGRTSVSKIVLGSAARFNAGFPAILAEREKEFMFYAMNLSTDGSIRKKLELAGPFRADDADEFLAKYAAYLDRHLAADSAQWRIWRAEGQFWR